jgi:ABC-2 type transport system ATP-binding protein
MGDTEVTRYPQRIKEMVGYLPDFFGVYEGMRVMEYLDFFGAAFKIPPKKRSARIEEVLDNTGSTYMKDMFVEALSRGMKQRVGIARTLIHDPQVLLLDEPLSGLDPTARIEMKRLLRKLGEKGKTILVSSHILPELAAIADSVGILDHGELLASGPVAEVMRGIRPHVLVEMTVLDDTEGAANLLRQIGQEAGIGEVEAGGESIRFEWQASDEELANLLATIVDKGFRVRGFEEVPLSLEEAFTELTTSKEDQIKVE